jgi:outer membrane receptor protein involved in Fe transport
MSQPSRRSPFGATLLLLITGLASTFAFGQGIVTGSVSGVVQDAGGAVIPGATVSAIDPARNTPFNAIADAQGFYSLSNLPVGTYIVTITAKGFSKVTLGGVVVSAGRNTGLPAQALRVGAENIEVTVEGAAPLIETTTAQISSTFSSNAVASIPLGGTGFDYLALFVPGMVNNGAANFSNTNGAAIANNGLRGRTNNFQIDGQGNNDNSIGGPSIFLNNPDVIGEVQVVTNNFGAEYGRNAGSVVNYITKAGSNSFHGTGFEFYNGDWSWSKRNNEENPFLGFCPPGVAAGTATQFSSKCITPVIPRYVDNRFGGTIGGPIKKDKAWFFGSYQNEKQRGTTSGTSSSLTPTPAGVSLLDSTFPGNAAVAWLKAQGPFGITAGNPQVAGTVKNLTVVGPGGTSASVPMSFVTRTIGNNFDDYQVTGRVDYQISEKNRFFGRYVFQKSTTAFGSGTVSTANFVAVPAKDQQIGLDFTRNWSNTMVSQFRFSYSRAGFGFEAGQARPDCSRTDYLNCPSQIAFSDSTNSFSTIGLANNLPQGRLINNSQWQGNNTKTFGRHTIKFGGEYDRQRSPNQFLPNVNGSFTFYSTGTQNAYSSFIQGAAGCVGGSGPSGTCSALSLTDGPFSFNFKEQDLDFYAQDDWRVMDNLTLNLGIRWDFYSQAVNLLHDITVQNVANGFWSATAPTNVTELPQVNNAWKNFGPNIGFAYTPHVLEGLLGQNKTVIRGGFRIAYDPEFYNMFLNVATGAPVVNAGQVFNVGVVGTTGAAIQAAYLPLIPRGANPGTRAQTRVTSNFHNPYTEMWSLGIEHQFTERIAFETRYVGNHSVGQFQTVDANPLLTGLPASLLPSGVAPCATAGAAGIGRLDCNFSLVRLRNNGAFSEYNGLQNQLTMRSFHNLSAVFSYTWSHAIDNVSDIFSSTGPISNPAPQNPFDPSGAERGNSAQNFPNVFNTYWAYEFPWMKSQEGLVGKVLGGWTWSGTYRYQTGSPMTPYQNVTNSACDTSWNANYVGTDSCRPILSNPNAPFDQAGRYTSATNFVNISTGQVTTPSAVHFVVNNSFADAALCNGNPFACTVGRNTYTAQARNQIDLSLAKNTKLSERFALELRGDVLNAFNHEYLGVPGLNINNPNIGAGGSYGTNQGNTGTRRQIIVSAHVAF